jgi:hypothetical protein
VRGPLLRRRPERALDAACREVEATVSRVTRIVLHASALADRLDAGAAVDGPLGPVQAGHVRVLREAAESGRRVVQQLALAADEGQPGR